MSKNIFTSLKKVNYADTFATCDTKTLLIQLALSTPENSQEAT